MADLVVWLVVLFIIYAMAWLAWRIVHPKRRVAPQPAPRPVPPVQVIRTVRPAPAVTAPGYLRKWTLMRQWDVAQEKNDWTRSFEGLAGPPAPQPKPQPTSDGAGVFARLRSNLDQL